MDVTGSGDTRFGRRIRVPVTVIASLLAGVHPGGSGVPAGTWQEGAARPDSASCSLWCASGGDWSAGGCWAKAGVAERATNEAVDSRNELTRRIARRLASEC